MNPTTPIQNDPIAIAEQAAFDEFGIMSGRDYVVYYRDILEDETGKLDGLTTYPERPGEMHLIQLWAKQPMVSDNNNRSLPESYIHEMAHVVAGPGAEHDSEAFNVAFERIFDQCCVLDGEFGEWQRRKP